MEKQDVLKLQTANEVRAAMAKNPTLWCEEISDHLAKIAKKENIELFGFEGALFTPIGYRDIKPAKD